MSGMQKVRNGGLIVAAIGVVAGVVGLLANSSDAGVGANIGAGMLLLAGLALLAVGSVVAVVSVIVGLMQK